MRELTLNPEAAPQFAALLTRLGLPFTHRVVAEGHQFTGPLDRPWKIFTGEEQP